MLSTMCYAGVTVMYNLFWNVQILILVIQCALAVSYFLDFEIIPIKKAMGTDMISVSLIMLAMIDGIAVVESVLLGNGIPVLNLGLLMIALGYILEKFDKSENMQGALKVLGVVMIALIYVGFETVSILAFS